MEQLIIGERGLKIARERTHPYPNPFLIASDLAHIPGGSRLSRIYIPVLKMRQCQCRYIEDQTSS